MVETEVGFSWQFFSWQLANLFITFSHFVCNYFLYEASESRALIERHLRTIHLIAIIKQPIFNCAIILAIKK